LSDRVVDYRVDATLDPVAHTVAGKQKLTWRNRSALEARSVYLHLYMNAFEGAHSTFYTERRRSAGGGRRAIDVRDGEWGHIELRSVAQGTAKVPWSFVHPDGGPAQDHTVVRLDLPAPVAGGASTTLDIDFLTKLPQVVGRTGYFGSFHLVGQWFPKIGVLELAGERGAAEPRWNVHEFHQNSEFYADFGNYDVRLTVPKGYTVGAPCSRPRMAPACWRCWCCSRCWCWHMRRWTPAAPRWRSTGAAARPCAPCGMAASCWCAARSPRAARLFAMVELAGSRRAP
jgi:hypothetical protein